MKNAACFLFSLVLAGGASAADPELFIRGGFNGWGTDNLLVNKGKGVYETQILLSPGNHPFKVGSRDWSAEWVINPSASITVAPGTAYRMDPHPGPEDYLFVKQTAAYSFSVDVSDPKAPLLRVARIDTPVVVAIDPHLGHASSATLTFPTFDGKQETARFSTPDPAAQLRSYAHSTTQQLRDPGAQHVTYQEAKDLPTVRSGNLAFDALFALAGAEMKQNAASQIRDGNYNGGAPIACDCFETGEKWHYVWTRDLSYAADLGLAMLDPQRVGNSLEFKLSPFRDNMQRAPQVAGSADGLQIIQDTGSGGSWPVSTDRVSWAFGAEQVLKSLPAAERKVFAVRALKALTNTIENDRIAAFDQRSGLYTGEQSFLDWREQSYAAWIVNDLASMATSKALSTNVGHYKALTLAAGLAREHGNAALARKYGAWALALKQAINDRLWLADKHMYSSLTAPHFDGAPMHKFDWLGQSLAIVTGVASPARARQILANYPHGPMGAPVIFPQQRGVPVYHNRAIWPFVTAYGLKAAAMAGNTSVADAAYATLTRAAALNLSNMENLEWLSGQPLLLDEQHPALIGPVINSKRQLWSVGAYLGMVIGEVFGVSTTDDGIVLRPFITAKLRRDTFNQTDVIALNALQLHGKPLTVRVHFPRVVRGDGYYSVARIELDGVRSSAAIAWSRLRAGSVVDIHLGPLLKGQQQIRRVSADPYDEADSVFSPTGNEEAPNVYRNGKRVTTPDLGATGCYAFETVSPSGNRSHHSAPICAGRGIEIAVTDPRVKSNLAVAGPNARFAEPHLKDWGKPADTFTVSSIPIAEAGNYAVQLRYHNSANQINLGISGGVKWITLRDSHGRVHAQGVTQLPHARMEKSNTPLVYSTPLLAKLAPGDYTLEMSDFFNMSYLQANSTFSAAGGSGGPSNSFDIYGVRLLRVE
ncbi:MAG: esterase [Pseudomonadota bacterium]